MENRLAYSVAEAARAIGVGRTKIYEAIGDGRLKVIKFGNRTLVRPEALTDFLETLRDTSRSPR